MNIPSKLIEEAVEQLASLLSIGKKSALRLVLQLLKRSPEEVERFANAFSNMRNNITYCKECGNISDTDICGICSSHNRDRSLICVVEDIRDVMAIESTQQFHGLYHVLGGIISPMDGIGPQDLTIDLLLQRANNSEVKEVILALSSTMEGDTTNFYLFKKLQQFNINLSQISRGIGIGDELEYADELTLGRSILNRVPYQNTMVKQ